MTTVVGGRSGNRACRVELRFQWRLVVRDAVENTTLKLVFMKGSGSFDRSRPFPCCSAIRDRPGHRDFYGFGTFLGYNVVQPRAVFNQWLCSFLGRNAVVWD